VVKAGSISMTRDLNEKGPGFKEAGATQSEREGTWIPITPLILSLHGTRSTVANWSRVVKERGAGLLYGVDRTWGKLIVTKIASAVEDVEIFAH
jgi:hypothetical protein